MAKGRPKGKKRKEERGDGGKDSPRRVRAPDGDEYEFPMPDFDEAAFMRREVEAARMSFITLVFGLAGGVLAWAASTYGADWKLGWVPILLILAGLRPLFQRMGYSEENTSPKGMVGNYFLAFFTAFALWVLLFNEPFASWL